MRWWSIGRRVHPTGAVSMECANRLNIRCGVAACGRWPNYAGVDARRSFRSAPCIRSGDALPCSRPRFGQKENSAWGEKDSKCIGWLSAYSRFAEVLPGMA